MKIAKLLKSGLGLIVALAITQPANAVENLISADALPESHVFVQTIESFADRLQKDSRGQLKLTVQANGRLGNDEQMLQAVHEGKVAMVRVNAVSLAGKVRSAELLSLPYLIRSEAHLRKVLEGPFGKRLDEELAEKGYVRLMYLYGGARNLFCDKPVYGPSDIRGVHVRTIESNFAADMFRSLGAVPVELPIGKTTEAFRNHQIDCASDNVETYVTEDYVRFAPYLILDEHARIPDILLMSPKIWHALTPAQQGLIRNAAQATMIEMAARIAEEQEISMKAAHKAGAKVIAHTAIAQNAFEEQAAQFYNHIVKNDRDMNDIMKILMTQ